MLASSIVDDLMVAAQALDDDIHIQRAGYMLLAALEVGPSIKALRIRTGVPWSALQNGSYYLRRDKVWIGSVMHYPWLDAWIEGRENEGMIGLLLDAMVGAGYCRRQMMNDQPAYRMRLFLEDLSGAEEVGMTHVEAMEKYRRPHKNRPLPLSAVHPRTGIAKVRAYRADICRACGWLFKDHQPYYQHPQPSRIYAPSPYGEGHERFVRREKR